MKWLVILDGVLFGYALGSCIGFGLTCIKERVRELERADARQP
jgi:hypothetical protein